MIVTVPERKAREIARKRDAAVAVTAALGDYARAHGGGFAIFGSVARGDIRLSSDFDVMVVFPSNAERAAGDAAEAICRRFGLVPDVHLASQASEALMLRVRRDARLVPEDLRLP